ncbi:MAG: epoxyqueuosine reductase [Oscillospiraceae bacterium]|jgi:epoxyqueuosine reductase|nr:epoxyqueuosine reductase [Oscillospiraceae bacterium]
MKTDLTEQITGRARELGIALCGIVRADVMDGYAERVRERIANIPDGESAFGWAERGNMRRTMPWAKSVVAVALDISRYRVPPALDGLVGKHFLFDFRSCPESREATQVAALGEYLASLGLRTESNNVLGLRWAAVSAGLGVFRRNNFFYGANGSRYWLWAWATDAETESVRETSAKPCPDGCDLCRRACPTGSLSAPYTMSMLTCVEHLTASGVRLAPDDPQNAQTGAWLYGCDACQDACPFNAKPFGTDEYPGLSELEEFLKPQWILSATYDELREKFSRKFHYIGADNLWKWKVTALNVLANDWQPQYAAAVRAALGDEHEAVREKAAYVARKYGETI